MLISPCDPCHWPEIRDQMTVAIETAQKLYSAPPPPQKTRHSVVGTKRSLEFWKLPTKVWTIKRLSKQPER